MFYPQRDVAARAFTRRGRWRISGDHICVSYAEGQRDPKWDCTEVKLKGNQIIWKRRYDREAERRRTLDAARLTLRI